jgi:hypothetical protein
MRDICTQPCHRPCNRCGDAAALPAPHHSMPSNTASRRPLLYPSGPRRRHCRRRRRRHSALDPSTYDRPFRAGTRSCPRRHGRCAEHSKGASPPLGYTRAFDEPRLTRSEGFRCTLASSFGPPATATTRPAMRERGSPSARRMRARARARVYVRVCVCTAPKDCCPSGSRSGGRGGGADACRTCSRR